MVTLGRTSATLLIAISFFAGPKLAEAQIAPGVQQSAAQTANVSGIVIQQDGATVSGASVTLSGPAVLSTATDSHGAFQFASVPHGVYKVTAKAAALGTATQPNIVVNGDITVSIQYGTNLATGTLKTIANVTTRSSGAHINVTPASIASVTPTAYAFQGNSTWREMLNRIPGVSVGGGVGAGASTQALIPDSPFQPVILTINGSAPYETAVTLDGMPLSSYSITSTPGTGVDLAQLAMPLFETADVVRGPGANSPSILDSVGGTLVLHPPGIVSRNSIENSFSNDPYGGFFSNTKAAIRTGKLSGTFVYDFNNSPGPLGAGPVFGAVSTNLAFINGNAVASGGQSGYAPPSPIWGQCFCVINTTMMTSGGFQSTAFNTHSGGLSLSYPVSPAVTAQVFYAGNQSVEYQPLVFDNFNFAPGGNYSGPLPPGMYQTRIASVSPSFAPLLTASSLSEEKLTAYLGNGILRVAAMQNYSYNAQRLITPPANMAWQLWGTGTYCANATCSATTPFIFNGQTASVSWRPSDFTFNSRGTNNVYLATYETQIGPRFYAGISAVKSANSATFGSIQHSLSGNPLTGTVVTSIGGLPIITQTVNEYRLHLGSEISDQITLDGSYYLINGSYHVQDPTDPTQAKWVDILFPYSAPRLGVTWRANRDTSLRFSTGGGFALPPIFDIVGTNATTPICNNALGTCTLSLTNTNLQPEKSFGWDLGTDFRVHHDTAVSLDFYRTDLYGQIFRSTSLVGTDPKTGFPIYSNIYQNLGHTRYAGLNVSVEHDVAKGVYWSAALGLTRGYVVSVPPTIYNIAGQTCNFLTGAGCTNTFILPGPNFNGKYAAAVPYANGSATWGYRWAPKRYIDIQANYQGNNNAYFQPAFVEWDAHASYAINKNFAVVATFRNISGINGQSYGLPQSVNPGLLAPVIAGTLFPQYPIPFGPRSLILTTDISL